MKKFLLFVIFLFLSMPVFSAENTTIFIPGATVKDVKQAIIARGMNKNWQVKSDSDYSLSIYRVKNDSASMVLYGTNYNMHPEERVDFTLLNIDNGVKLSYNAYVAINPGGGYEKHKTAPLLVFGVSEMLKELFIGVK